MLASFLRCFARYPLCSQNLLLTANLSVFTLIWPWHLLRSPTPSPWLLSLKKEWCCWSGPRWLQLLQIMVPQSRRNSRKHYLKYKIRYLSITFFTFPGEFFFLIQGNVAHARLLFLADRSEIRNPNTICISSIVTPVPMIIQLNQMWIKNRTCLMTGTPMTRIFLHELQNIVLDKTWATSLHKENDCLHVIEFEDIF